MGLSSLRRHRRARGVNDEANNPHAPVETDEEGNLVAGKDVKVSELEKHLAAVDDAATIESWAGADKRKTAGPLYEARLAELAEAAAEETAGADETTSDDEPGADEAGGETDDADETDETSDEDAAGEE